MHVVPALVLLELECSRWRHTLRKRRMWRIRQTTMSYLLPCFPLI